MSIITKCKPRKEIISDDLSDAMFAADFGNVIEKKADKIYSDPKKFFDSTHPSVQLKKIADEIFSILSNKKKSGSVFRLSTGFGGGKTHALIALYHLAKNIKDHSLGTELLPAAGRPSDLTVVAIDAGKAGYPVFSSRGNGKTNSLHGEFIFKLGEMDALKKVRNIDRPDASPDDKTIERVFPKGPVLILLDELVVYLARLAPTEQSNAIGFLNTLAGIISNRKQCILVLTDPANQVAYYKEAQTLEQELVKAAERLGDLAGRWSTDHNPIGDESAQVIGRRLFEKIDEAEAQKVSASYHEAYKRIKEEHPHLIADTLITNEYAQTIVSNYPFHPKLVNVARDRISVIPEFNQSRGVLRLFARIIKDTWEAKKDVDLIMEGDIDWSSDRIQGDLIQRLNKDNFRAAIDADVKRHAKELDDGKDGGIHQRVATALLLESLPLDSNSGMDEVELTEAVITPNDAGDEAAEAIDRLVGVCWHLYPKDGTRGHQFRYEENILKKIEAKKVEVSLDDAKNRVFTEVTSFFKGPVFSLAQWPQSAKQVSNKQDLQLALCESSDIARNVVQYEDDSNPDALIPRRFRNSILAITAKQENLNEAIEAAQRLKALEGLEKEYRRGAHHRLNREQIASLKPKLVKAFKLRSCRAFNVLQLPDRKSIPIEEKYQVPEEDILRGAKGQENLKKFLLDKGLMFKPGDQLDVDRFLSDVLPGTTPIQDDPNVYTGKAVHERFLSAKMDRLVPDKSVVRKTIIQSINKGKLVVKASNGTAYDKDGSVSGIGNGRKRYETPITTLALDEDDLIGVSDSSYTGEWFKTGDKGGGKTPPPPPPVPEGDVTAVTWEEVVTYSKERALINLKLKAINPQDAQQLLSIAQPLNAKNLKITVTARGETEKGGQLAFQARDIKPNHPIKPLQTATAVFNAVSQNESFQADLQLEYDDDGVTGISPQLETAREKSPADMGIEAKFGKKNG